MSAKVHNALHNQNVVAQVAIAYAQTSVGSVLPLGRTAGPLGGTVIDADAGLRASQPEASCLIPAIRIRHEPKYVLFTLAGEVYFAVVATLSERLYPLAASGRLMV